MSWLNFTVCYLLALLVHSGNGAPLEIKTIKVVGDRFVHPKDKNSYVQVYVLMPESHTSATTPVAVGLELTKGFVEKAMELPIMLNITIPLGPERTFNYLGFDVPVTNFPMVGTNPFEFVYWGFGPNGHPPVGIYDVPHFDFHFMYKSVDYWWGQEWTPASHGPCLGGTNETFYKAFKPIPTSCYPGGKTSPVTQVGDFVWGMGVHLMDMSFPEFNPPRHFNYTQIYGMYDGQIAYMEPMISKALMQKKGVNECRTLPLPRAVPEPRLVPSQLCLENKGKTFNIEYRGFKRLTVGCSTSNGFMGQYPAEAPQLPPSMCTVPTA